MKMAKDIGVDIDLKAAADTLRSVGFVESKFEDPVAELSVGWRMRLTLGVSMLKHLGRFHGSAFFKASLLAGPRAKEGAHSWEG